MVVRRRAADSQGCRLRRENNRRANDAEEGQVEVERQKEVKWKVLPELRFLQNRRVREGKEVTATFLGLGSLVPSFSLLTPAVLVKGKGLAGQAGVTAGRKERWKWCKCGAKEERANRRAVGGTLFHSAMPKWRGFFWSLGSGPGLASNPAAFRQPAIHSHSTAWGGAGDNGGRNDATNHINKRT